MYAVVLPTDFKPQPVLMPDVRIQVSARLRNPLAGIPRNTLMADVEEFARQKDLTEHLPMLKKGAILAQNPVSRLRFSVYKR